jgi:pimeloyl-ACP methyl ester carboxylesterase
MRRIEVNGLTLAVHDEGEGPPVLLVHGFPDCHDVWRNQLPALVAAGYRVIALDTRGCGDSDTAGGSRNYRPEALVADLVGLLDALGLDKVRLVAHDMGAVMSWQLCMRHPERIVRYVAMSVGHPSAYASASLEQKLKGWYVLAMQLRGIAEWGLRAFGWKGLRALVRYDEELPQWIRRLSRPGRLTAAVNYYRGAVGLILPRRWPSIRVPTLGIWSDGDLFLAESQMIRSQQFVDAPWRYERIHAANHWLQLTAPEQVNALLRAYLR